MVRTQIQLTEKQARSLKRLAVARQVSIAELIRRGVDTLLQSDSSIDLDEKRRRAIAAAGRFRSGRHDISRKHDKYLVEALNR